MIDGVVGGQRPAVLTERFTRVGIHIESREVAARDIDAYSMAFLEDIRSRERL
jgi:hypothetical protein